MGGNMMKKIVSVLLCALLLISALPMTALAEEATASTMRLEKCEGTVTVKNASGKTLKITDKMRLYNGYEITTAAKSYAYISLDGTKAVKLDTSTKVSVTKAGKKLEILVSSGKLLFDVSAPLDDDESLEIRTSTSLTGVRGTVGYVTVTSPTESVLTILEGVTEVTTINPTTGEKSVTQVSSGQQLSSLMTPEEDGGEVITVVVTDITPEEIPGFVLTYVAENPEVQERIEENSELEIQVVVANAEEIQKLGEAEAEAKSEKIQQQIEEQTKNLGTGDTDPLFTEPPTPPSEPVIPEFIPIPDPTPTPTPDPDPTVYYTVTFDMNGHGDPIEDQSVAEGDTVNEPIEPTANGYIFGGWYQETECLNRWDFIYTVNSDITLYAMWTEDNVIELNDPTLNELQNAMKAAALRDDIELIEVTNADLVLDLPVTIPDGATVLFMSGTVINNSGNTVTVQGRMAVNQPCSFINNGTVTTDVENFPNAALSCDGTLTNNGIYLDYAYASSGLPYVEVSSIKNSGDDVYYGESFVVYVGAADGTNWIVPGFTSYTATFYESDGTTMYLPSAISDASVSLINTDTTQPVNLSAKGMNTLTLKNGARLSIGSYYSGHVHSYDSNGICIYCGYCPPGFNAPSTTSSDVTEPHTQFTFNGNIDIHSTASMSAILTTFTGSGDQPVITVTGDMTSGDPSYLSYSSLLLDGCTVYQNGTAPAIDIRDAHVTLTAFYSNTTNNYKNTEIISTGGIGVLNSGEVFMSQCIVEGATIALSNTGTATGDGNTFILADENATPETYALFNSETGNIENLYGTFQAMSPDQISNMKFESVEKNGWYYCTLSEPTFTVTFHMNGADIQNLSQTVTEGSLVKPLEAPSTGEFLFDGWYTDPDCTPGNLWDFNTPIYEDTVLYAKWLTAYTLSVVNAATTAALTAALAPDSPYDIVILDIGDTVWTTSTIEIPEGKTLKLVSGTIATLGYNAIINRGTFIMEGGLINADSQNTFSQVHGIACRLTSSTTVTGGKINVSGDAITTEESGSACSITIAGGEIIGGNAALNLRWNTTEDGAITLSGGLLIGNYGITCDGSSNSRILIQNNGNYCANIIGRFCTIDVAGNSQPLTISGGMVQGNGTLINTKDEDGIVTCNVTVSSCELIYSSEDSEMIPETPILPAGIPISNSKFLCYSAIVIVNLIDNGYQLTQIMAPFENHPFYYFAFGESGDALTLVSPSEYVVSELSRIEGINTLNISDFTVEEFFQVGSNMTVNLSGGCEIYGEMEILGSCTVAEGTILINAGTIHVGNEEYPSAMLTGNVENIDDGQVIYYDPAT